MGCHSALLAVACVAAALAVAAAQTGTCSGSTNLALPPAGTYSCAPDGSICCTRTSSASCPVCGAISFTPSVLYGCAGEQWKPTSRLLDFSYAGYRGGEDALPDAPASVDIKALYGARGDGVTDDTQAFLAALADVGSDSAVIFIPAGRYVISRKLDITKRVVLRGAGRNATTLLLTKSLTNLGGNTWTSGNSQYTYSPALINFWGSGRTDATTLLATVTRNAWRGNKRLYVSSTAKLGMNSWLRLVLDNVNNVLLADLHSYLIPPDPAFNNRTDIVSVSLKVTEIGPDYVGFDRPLPVNVSTLYRPELHSWASYTRTECGVEQLTIQMPWSPYAGMNKEAGWNALNFWWTPNSWVSDVAIFNADLGVVVDGSSFFTVNQLFLGVTARRGPAYDGTWGVWLKGSNDVLVTRFNVSAVFTQDVTVQAFQLGNVISNGVGTNLSINALYAGPYGTLISNVNYGAARVPYGPSGAAPKASSFLTLWNVRGNAPLSMPRPMYGPKMTFIGAALGPFIGVNASLDWYVENNGTTSWPVDLQADQLAFRLAPKALNTAFGPGYGCDPTRTSICCIGYSNMTCPACPPGYGLPSKLWGCAGELYRLPNSTGSQRLLDWSYAGYMAGEMPLPTLPVVTTVTDFGAVGDGVADDSQAFLDAIAAIGRSGTILIPEGRYKITRQLNIPNRVILRGEGPANTRLVFPKSLSEVFNTTARQTYGPGFIQFNGATWLGASTFLANVTKNVLRGDTVLSVSSTAGFTPGMWLRLVLSSPAGGGLVTNMMSGLIKEGSNYLNKPNLLSFNSRITFVGVGFVKLQRPLPYNVSTAWSPSLHNFDLSLTRQQVGVEALTVEFPLTPYRGFGSEAGYNGIYFWSTAHCWVKNVAIINADMAVTLDGTYFCTIDNLQLSSGGRGINNGAWGVWLKNGADNIIKNFNAGSRLVRDIAVQGLQPGTVIANSTGVDLCIETMNGGPYGLLLSNLHMGYGSRPWGQNALNVIDATSFNTFWNIRSNSKMPPPSATYGPLLNLVSLNMSGESSAPGLSWYNENATSQVYPVDLYASQHFSRLGGTPVPDLSAGQVAYVSPGYACNGWSRCLVGTSNATLPACPANYTSPSIHYGCAGELWRPAGRLPNDWGFAGFANGDRPVPNVPVVASVKDYGAKGDNITDDTAAFLRALNDSRVVNGALFIPAGVYRIRQALNIRKSVVLRGAGRDLTTIYIPVSLSDVYGNTWSEAGPGSNVSDYSHGTGFINWWGWDPVAADRTLLARVTAAAPRGASVLQVSTTVGMSVGQWVRVNLDDPGNGSLVLDMNSGLMPGGRVQFGARSLIRQLSRISQIGAGWIRLERPLIANVSLAYSPTIHRFLPSVQNAGIENLTISFPLTKYPGHLQERGYNGIHFNQLAHSWVRDVRIHNADSGFYSWGMVASTVSGLTISSGARGYDNGHRGIWLERGQDNLITNFRFDTMMYHDVSVSFYEHGTAFVNGSGKDLNMDHHRAAPYATLWSNIDTGIGSRTFASSGDGGANGNHTSSWSTFWNVRGKLNALLPEAPDFGPNLNFLGLKTLAWVTSPYNWVLEKPPARLSPPDLYCAQRLSRASRLWQPPNVTRPTGVCG